MLVHSNASSTPTPGSSASTSNTLEPVNTSTNSSSSQLHQHLQQSSSLLFSLQQSQQKQQQISCISTLNSRPPSRAPSILDSPTLARVERARLKLEASAQPQHNINGSCCSISNTLNDEDSLERVVLDPNKKEVPWHQVWTHMKRLSHASKVNSSTAICSQKTDITATGKSLVLPDNRVSLKDTTSVQQVFSRPDMQSLLAGRIPVSAMTGPIKRGLLWQQRDRLFSRWKERYFVLTRDYLHCFKRASGSANERASDMGQFIFKVKLVDVEKVEWLNRRSYSAIGLLLGREGRVLLRCDEGLEDWFELLEECTITSKERRKALKIAQGPRSRASLAAPVSHASLQRNHFSLGGTYLTALDDWLMTNGNSIAGSRNQKLVTNSICGYGGTNPFLFSDSVPDLSTLNNENHNHISGISTNHSTPQKMPYSSAVNNSRYSNGYASQNSSSSYGNGLYGSPRRIFINSSFGSTHIVDEEAEDGEVELRRPRIFRHLSTDNGNEIERDWYYRKPKPPTDLRHSVQPILPTTQNNASLHKLSSDVDHSANDSGVDTPPSTHRPSSYREQTQCHNHYNQQFQKSSRDSTETSVSSSRGTILNSPGGSFRAKHVQQISNLNNFGTRYNIQERILKIRNEEDHYSSIKSANRSIQNDLYDPNQNRYHKIGNQSPVPITPQNTPNKKHVHSQQHLPLNFNGNSNSNNNNNNNNNNNMTNGSAICRERYQHPALTALINDTQSIIYRDRSYSDCVPSRRSLNNNLSPLTGRKNHINPIFGTPTRV